MDRSGVVRAGLALGVAAWASVAVAQSGGAGGGDGTPLSERRLEGRVVSVDPQHRSLTMDVTASPGVPMPTNQPSTVTGDRKQLTVAPRAHVVRDGLNVAFDEVQPGDALRATFLSDDLARTQPYQLEALSPGGRAVPWGVNTGE